MASGFEPGLTAPRAHPTFSSVESLLDYVISPAGPGDAADLANVHVRSWRQTYPGILPQAALSRMSIAAHTRRFRLELTRAHKGQVTLVNGHPWRRALSTTSTFGARVKPLLEDRRMMDMAMESGGAFDHTTCLMYQGHMPYPMFALTEPLRSTKDARDWLRRAAISTMRAGLNGYQAMRRVTGSSIRLLVAPEPALNNGLELVVATPASSRPRARTPTPLADP